MSPRIRSRFAGRRMQRRSTNWVDLHLNASWVNVASGVLTTLTLYDPSVHASEGITLVRIVGNVGMVPQATSTALGLWMVYRDSFGLAGTGKGLSPTNASSVEDEDVLHWETLPFSSVGGASGHIPETAVDIKVKRKLVEGDHSLVIALVMDADYRYFVNLRGLLMNA